MTEELKVKIQIARWLLHIVYTHDEDALHELIELAGRLENEYPPGHIKFDLAKELK